MKEEIEKKIQSQIYNKWYSRKSKYILHIGPTNSGKTFSAVQSLKQSDKGIYLAPLRLLAWEIYEKLNSQGHLCTLLTGEEKIRVPNANLTSCTIEMCDFRSHFNVAVIDECFMIADNQRGKFWLKAIMEVEADEIHIISNPESLDLIKNLLDLTNNNYIINKYERKTPLEVLEQKIQLNKLPPKTVLVTFSRINVLYYKYLLQQYGVKTSVLYGNLPPEVKKEQIKNFINNVTDVLVSTDVIGMGINLPCDNIVFMEDEKFDGEDVRPLNNKEIKQISGRAGRYGLCEKGVVSSIDPDFTEEIKIAFDSMELEQFAIYGLDGEIYKMIPEDTPKKKIKYFEKLNILPKKLKPLFHLEDLEKYYILAKYYDINYLSDDVAWAFLSCPVNNNNFDFWKNCVSSAVHHNKINFTEKYSTAEINELKQLEQAEIDIANIDLFNYMFNNRILKNLFPSYNTDFIHILNAQKNVIVENMNNYLLLKKIKAKEVHKSKKL